MTTLKLQLYMWRGIRQHLLARHNFYVEQVSTRLLSQFPDIEAESEQFADREYERLASAPARDDIDLGDLAEFAHERGLEHYMLLHDLKQQTLLGALAGMYHQWDKDLRDFIEHELAHDVENPEQHAWRQGNTTFEILKLFGWDTTIEPFFKAIDACRLVVNVYKHGKGQSLTKLAEQYPEYLRNPLSTTDSTPAFVTKTLDYEWLTVSPEQFDDFAQAFRSFWEEFPERLFLTVS